MYHHKFDEVLLVSPSHAKMGIKVKVENTTSKFSLDWIFDRFNKINEKQLNEVFGNKLKSAVRKNKSETGKLLGPGMVMNDNRSRFILGDMFKPMPS